MKKKIFSFLTVLCMVLALLPTNMALAATRGTCGDNLTWTLDDEGTLTVSGTGNMKYWSTESTTAPWYSLRRSIKSVVIDDGVTSIDYNAFNDCSRLTSVTIPNSVTLIDCFAFYGCESLANITIPDSVTNILGNAFKSTAFYNDASNWDNNALYIDNILMELNNEFSGEYIIKSGTRVIAYGAFSDCSNLTSVTIPDSVTNLCSYAFSGCSSLTSVTIPDSVICPDDFTLFYKCTSLRSITIPDNVQTIGHQAFSGCSSLTSVKIPDGVTSIDSYAFSHCSSLTSITIPNSVTSIGFFAFWDCPSLKTVYYKGTEADWSDISIDPNSKSLINAERIYLECTKTAVSDNGKSFTVTPKNIQSGVTVIIALYNDNTLVEMQSAVFYGKDITFNTKEDYTSVKVMAWDSLSKLKPACEDEAVK